MKMREVNRGRKLKVRWTTEEWSPAITHLAAPKRLELLGDELPRLRKTTRRKKQVLWTGGMVRLNRNNLPGLNGSRTTWR